MRLRPLPLFAALGLLAVASLATAVAAGSVDIPLGEVLPALRGEGPPLHVDIIHELRLPRALAAFAAGGLLALSGALLQVLLRNPLADPYVLGVSGGAAVGALGTMVVGLAGLFLPVGAFLGALVSTLIVFGLAHGSGRWTPTRLLLTGVVVAAAWGAVINLLLAVAPDRDLRGMVFWLMGDLSHADHAGAALAVLGLGLLACLPAARSLNLLARGELVAGSLGVSAPPLRLFVYFMASLLTAVAVTLGGSIGFVGLVAPHILRLAGAGDHRLLLPAAVLFGGSLLVLADTLARTVVAPQQLPVGVLTALLGAPLFLYLLQRGYRS